MEERIINVDTPCIVYDERLLDQNVLAFKNVIESVDIKPLYSLKACSLVGILEKLQHTVLGFSCSSLFEVQLAREIIGNEGIVHFTSPGVNQKDYHQVFSLSDYISFNSISQFDRFASKSGSNIKFGIRVNTRLSFIEDKRYDPSRKYSKLGASIEELNYYFLNIPARVESISGLHFHNNCESRDFNELNQTIEQLDARLSEVLKRVKWINIGGGYIFSNPKNLDSFISAVSFLKNKYDLELFIEPGAGLVGSAACLVATVIDLMVSDGKPIAVLDTTVNHLPEVFEYQYEPEIAGHIESGEYEYIVVGSSCLAGDIFGEYKFNAPLEVGSKIIIKNVGAYSLVKANMFNGINLPSIYKYTENDSLELLKEYTYEDFRSRLGESSNATLRERIKNTRYEKSSKVTSISRG